MTHEQCYDLLMSCARICRDGFEGYTKWLLNGTIIAAGHFTASSARMNVYIPGSDLAQNFEGPDAYELFGACKTTQQEAGRDLTDILQKQHDGALWATVMDSLP